MRHDPPPDPLRATSSALARVEEELRLSRARLAGIVASAMDAIITVNERQEVVVFNAAAEQIFGLPESEAIGRPLDRFIPARLRAAHQQHIQNFAKTGVTSRTMRRPGILSAVRASGEEFPIEASISHMESDGQRFFTVILRDVTERHRAEEALRQREAQLREAQKMEAVGQLAGGIAHDFNNLLTAITSYTELLLADTAESAPQHLDLLEIQRAADRATALTRQLLTFSRRRPPQPQVLDLSIEARSVVKLLGRLLDSRIQVEIEVDADVWLVRADPGQIEQVLMNLGVNARDALPEGGRVLITLRNVSLTAGDPRCASGLPSGEYVELAVADNGIGMDAETKARLFEPFFTTKPPGMGTGLGLATVYGIVEQAQGHVEVESEPGQGATFRILLRRHQGMMPVAPRREASGALAGGHETILLVEDEAVVRDSTRRLLERQGYTVLEARHGADALRLLEEDRRIDLVLSDVVMPEMGGGELSRRAQQARPGLRMVFMSGYTDKGVRRQEALPPDAHFLAKPFHAEALLGMIRRVLDDTHAADQA